MIYREPIDPTVGAIDAWRAQTERNKPPGAVFATEMDNYGVTVWTVRGRARFIVGRSSGSGDVYYVTRSEANSRGPTKLVKAEAIVRAEGWIVGCRDPRFRSNPERVTR